MFCCSTETADDREDQYVRGNLVRHTKAVKPQDTKPSIDNNLKKRKEKNDEFDDNSANETETIANTDEPSPTTLNTNNNSSENTQRSGSKDKNNHNSTHIETTNNKDDSSEEKKLKDDENLKQREEDNVIIAQQNNNEDIADLDLQYIDEESLMDLTKFQEGQYRNPETGWLLGHKDPIFKNKKCLILDLDETLVHSSFKYLRTADFVIPVEIDNQIHHVYVIKRPGVDEFLKKVGQWFEVVVFTASVLKYGDPLLNKLDINKSIHHRLFRDSCYNYEGNFIKNLSQIGRPLTDSIIIDNSPASYIFHPQHSVPISSWFSDTHDNELLDLLPFLEDLSKENIDDVSLVLDVMI